MRNFGIGRHGVSRRFALLTGAASALAAVMPTGVFAAAATAQKPSPSFFNSVEVRSSDLTPFTKWRAALKRYSEEANTAPKSKCAGAGLEVCNYDDWKKLIESLKGQNPLIQLRDINDHMNKAPYVADPTNWGENDYWATPAEFMTRFGDCEDYAIIKYLSLRRLGWQEKDLRVVAVKDMNLKVGHAVLVVFFKHPTSGEIMPLLLDNQIKQIVHADRVRHYQPVFSLNQFHWWRHTPVMG